MAGPTVEAQYKSDDGVTYCVRLPAWEGNLQNHAGTLGPQTVTACSGQASLPRGYIRRKRMVRLTTTGRENGVTILDPASALWTATFNTPVVLDLFNAAPPGADNATLQGAIGERRLKR